MMPWLSKVAASGEVLCMGWLHVHFSQSNAWVVSEGDENGAVEIENVKDNYRRRLMNSVF